MAAEPGEVVLNLEPAGFSPCARQTWEKAGEYIEAEFDSAAEHAAASRATTLIVRLQRPISRQVLERYPRLRCLVSATTGLDHLDLAALQDRGVRLLSLRGEQEFLKTIPSTAELAFGLIIALLRNIPAAHAAVLDGRWDRDAFRGRQLQGRRLGIVGMGRTGSMVAAFGQAFGMQVAYNDPHGPEARAYRPYDRLDALLADSEIVSVHVHLTDETRGLLGENIKRAGCRGLYLVNTSRGAVLDESAIVASLQSGVLAGLATDVLATELDGVARNLIVDAARDGLNVIVTPHIGGATSDAMQACEELMARRFQEAQV